MRRKLINTLELTGSKKKQCMLKTKKVTERKKNKKIIQRYNPYTCTRIWKINILNDS